MKGFLLTAANFRLLWLGLGLLVVGYILLGQGPVDNPLSWSVAPVLLVVAYCVILPWSVMTGRKHKGDEQKKGV